MENHPNQTIGKYQLINQLGQGGMAEVYKALQPGLNRYVALKIMSGRLAQDPSFAERFEQEAAAIAKLRHPNIIQVYDFDHQDNRYYLVMEFIDGSTLEAELKERAGRGQLFKLNNTVRIFNAMAGAIDHAHSQGMIHQDMKPSNVLISNAGQIVLTDFGIAHLMGAGSSGDDEISGTPAYMAPEQSQGQNGDGRSDIYALGVILFEMTAGRLPFEGTAPFAVIMKHLTEAPPSPRSLNPDLPEEVEQIILKALSKDPRERYQTAGEMAQALRAAVGMSAEDAMAATPLPLLASKPDATPVPAASVSVIDPPTTVLGVGGTPAPLVEKTPAPAAPAITNPPVTNPPVTNPPVTNPPITNPPAWSAPPGAERKKFPVVAVILGLLLASALIGGAAWFFTAIQDVNQSDAVAAATAGAAANASEAQQAEATQTWLAADDDRDGLSNSREIELNTLPNKRDTDEDGLDDGEEVLNRGTDPLKADTDGDGLKDGNEVSRGLNPLNRDSDGDGLLDPNDPDPIRAPTTTVTPTPTPTASATPTPTATASPTKTPRPTATPRPASVATQSSTGAVSSAPAHSAGSGQAQPGLFQDFESVVFWKRGDEANGTFQQSAADARSGRYAGQLRYNFPSKQSDYVVFLWSRSLSGNPNQISAWVKGDKSGAYLNVWVKDNQGQTWQFSFGQIKHSGWQQMTAYLDPELPWPAGHVSGTDNGKVDYPISFQGLVLDDAPDSFSGSGTIYIDDLTSLRGTIPATATEQLTAETPKPVTLKGKIAFEVSRTAGTGVNPGVYWMDLKTMEAQQFSGNAGSPNLASNGGMVVWKQLSGIDRLNMNAARWQAEQITSDKGDRDPVISTRGDRIAYVNAEGLYIWANGIAALLVSGDAHPWWDPDDNWLVYGFRGSIYKVLIDKREPVQIAEPGEDPSWGPDRRVAFVKEGDIYIMDENGNSQAQLTDHAANDYQPAWSPDGKKIIFVSERDGNAELYTMNPDGSNQQRLTNTPYWETSPSWGR